MRPRFFERELICEFDDNGDVVRLQRMTFTADELRAVSVMLNAALGVVGYGYAAKTIASQFEGALVELNVQD